MRNFLSFSSCSLPVLCLWLLTYCLLICRTAASVSYAAQVQPLDGPVAQRGAKCLSDLQSGAIVPSSAGPNKGIVINVEGCYDHSSLGLEDAMVFFPLAEEGKLFFPPLDYNATWLQPNYFPSFGVGNETDYVLPGSSSSSGASTASDGSGSSSTGGGTSGRAYSAELLSMFAAGQSTSSHHLLSTLNVLQDLCAAQCQQALFYPAPTGDVNRSSSSSNISTGAPAAAQPMMSNGVFSFRFVIAYGNCYCLNETASALAYAHLNLATSLPCCLAAPSWALANNRSNISTMFPQSSAPRCSSSKLYGVMYTADLACPTNVSRCGGVDGGGTSSPCRMEEGCCVQYLAAPSPPIAMASNVTLYIMALLFTVIALQVFWWTFKWYVLRRHRRLARGDDEVNDLQLLLMRQALHGWQQRQQPPLALSRTKDEAVDAASEAMSLLEVAVGESIPPEDCCPMCLEELSTQECVRVLCGHIIHTSCMKEFLAHKLRSYFCPVTCPMCRATVLVQQPVDESPPLGARASPVGGGAYMPPLVLPNGEGEVANGVAVVEQLPPRRRRRFRHLNDEEIARANLIISRLLHRHEQLQDHLVAVRLRDEDDDDGDVEDARAMQVADRGGGGAGRQAHLEQIRREIAAEDDEVTHQGTSNAVAPDAATAAGRIGDIERQDVERWLTHRSSPLGPATQGGGELRPLPSPSGEVQQNLGRDPLADSISSLHAHPSRDGQPRLGDTSNIDNSANQRRDDGDGAEGGNRPSSSVASVEHAMSDAARRIMQDL